VRLSNDEKARQYYEARMKQEADRMAREHYVFRINDEKWEGILAETVAKKDAQIDELMVEKDAQIDELVAEKDAQMAEKDALIAELQAQLDTKKASD